MLKPIKSFGMVLMICLLLLALTACSDSKTLAEDQYQILRNGNTFTVKVTDNSIEASNIESVTVKIRYKYTVVEYGEYGNGSIYATDIKNKIKTETFEVEKSNNLSGSFVGSFTVDDSVFEYKCKKAVAHYADEDPSFSDIEESPSYSDEIQIGILEAIGISVGFCIVTVAIWFFLSLFLDVNTAFYIASIPGIVGFLGLLVTGQWIPAVIFLLAIGASISIAQAIYNKFCG